jgi:hypothetical protein
LASEGCKTVVVVRDLYPSKQALEAIASGSSGALGETFEQLEALLATLRAS